MHEEGHQPNEYAMTQYGRHPHTNEEQPYSQDDDAFPQQNNAFGKQLAILGCLDDRVRMITTMKKCEAGLNGGFSPNGQIAALVGSTIIAVLAFVSEQNLELAALVAIIGWLGCQVDSVLGAVLENRGLMTKGTVNAAAITSGIIAMWWYLGFPHL